MKLIGCMAVRNEAWVLGLSLRVALQWCDEMVVLLHVCTDDSAAIVETIQGEHPGRVIVRTHRHECWTEMAHRQQMLEIARSMNATHLAIVDCDEILTGNMLAQVPYGNSSLIRHTVDVIPKGSCLQLPMYQLRGSLDRYHANGIWGNRWLSVAFQDDPKLSWSGDKFHSREPQGMTLKPYRPIAHGQGGSFHLWGVSERRLRAKHALYKVTERLRWPSKDISGIERMYNQWRGPMDPGNPGLTWTFTDVPAEWWRPYNRTLIHDDDYKAGTTLWQEAEVKRLVAQHGAETFAGLDLFGVA